MIFFDKAFSQPNLLNTHIKSIHKQAEKKYKCDFCNEVFGTYFHLNEHVNKIHERLKNYKCEFCV